MSDMDKVDAFLAKTEELIEEVEAKKFGIRRVTSGIRHVRTPQGARRYSDAVGTPIEINKEPDRPDIITSDSSTEGDHITMDLPAHKPLKPRSAPATAPEPVKVGKKGTKLPPSLVHALKRLSPRGTPNGAGTPDDPIDVGDDIPKAAKLLAEGKSIRMKDNHTVATLIDELAKIGNDAREKGEKAPDYDLCKVSVPGTNLFCYENKGIPRAEMPQFKGQAVPGSLADSKRKTDALDEEVDVEDEYRAALDAMGVKITPKTVKASELKATQSQLVGVKVAGMSKAMEAGKIKDAPIFVTRDGYIIDGHHRWAAKVALDLQDGKLGDVEMPVNEIDMEIGEAIDFANLFAKIVGLAPKAGAGVGAKSLKDCTSGACGWNEHTLIDAYLAKVEEVIN